MKNLRLLFLMLIVLTSCEDGFIARKESLPPITQTGANTVGCLVNGKVFLPHQRGINAAVNCFYQYSDGNYYFTLAFGDTREGIEDVNIFVAKTTLVAGQKYELNQGYGTEIGGGAEYYFDLNNKYNTNKMNKGELKITRIDVKESIISGTFWFDAVNAKGEKVEIREGRFDWNYGYN